MGKRDSEKYPSGFCANVIDREIWVAACIFLILAGHASINAAAPGFLEGHLKIISPKGVELADETPSKMTAENYADHPLVILNQDGKKEIAHVTPDENRKYRVALPPGAYILDVKDRVAKRVRAKPQPFTVVDVVGPFTPTHSCLCRSYLPTCCN